jgi:hypothetical protein
MKKLYFSLMLVLIGCDKVTEVGDPILSLNPNKLEFVNPGDTLTFSIFNTGESLLEWVITKKYNWLDIVGNSFGSLWTIEQSEIKLVADPTKLILDDSTYADTLLIKSNGGEQSIAIKIYIPLKERLVIPNNNIIIDTAESNSFVLKNVGGRALDYNLSYNTNLISLNPENGQIVSNDSALIIITPKRENLPAGVYSDSIEVRVPQVVEYVKYSFRVLESGKFCFAPSNKVSLGTTESSVTVYLINCGEKKLTWNYTLDKPLTMTISFFSEQPINPLDSVKIDISIDREHILPGDYQAKIFLCGDSICKDTVFISFNEPNTATITANPDTLDFGAETTVLDFEVIKSGKGSLNWFVLEDINWMSVSPTSGSASATLRATVDRVGLEPGTYTGTFTIDAGKNGKTDVFVRMTVTGIAIDYTPKSIYFPYTDSTLTLTIFNTGYVSTTWVISSPVEWLELQPNAGVINASAQMPVIIKAVRKRLKPIEHTSQLILTVGATSFQIPVTLEMTSDYNCPINESFDDVPDDWTIPQGFIILNGLMLCETNLIAKSPSFESHDEYAIEMNFVIPSDTLLISDFAFLIYYDSDNAFLSFKLDSKNSRLTLVYTNGLQVDTLWSGGFTLSTGDHRLNINLIGKELIITLDQQRLGIPANLNYELPGAVLWHRIGVQGPAASGRAIIESVQVCYLGLK